MIGKLLKRKTNHKAFAECLECLGRQSGDTKSVLIWARDHHLTFNHSIKYTRFVVKKCILFEKMTDEEWKQKIKKVLKFDPWGR